MDVFNCSFFINRNTAFDKWCLQSSAGVQFLNRLPNSIKHAPTPKALKTRLKRFLVSHSFYNAGEFLEFDWETAQLED
ncbi:hypothetical protein J6590_077945 [Homalodisca vitripennis]|nr:hypothetical protein J6590_077945 [Homalodisca vitripennis]